MAKYAELRGWLDGELNHALKILAAARADERDRIVKQLRTRETEASRGEVHDWLFFNGFADRVLDEKDESTWDECAALRNVVADLIERGSPAEETTDPTASA